MKKTLLIDLDNTLLANDMATFVPAYLQALAHRMSPYADPKLLINALLAATNRMVQNQDPELTLMDVFDSAFYPALNLNKADVQAVIEQFYAEDFPHLRQLTSQKPEAIQFVKQALRLGYQVGIATNPLFPLTAIHQRLTWAGLPVDENNFCLVPSYSSFHFTKPNPAYFAEFLAQMGWESEAVVMVGDEIELDIAGARQLGIATYWMPSPSDSPWQGSDPEPPKGSFSNLLTWLEHTHPERLKYSFQTPQALLAVLRSTPAALNTLCNSNASMDWTYQPQPGEWSLTEVLCHLRDVETEAFMPRFTKVINEDNPFLTGIDTDPWAQQRQYIKQDGRQALREFVAKRKELLSLLSGLSPEDWQRSARHAIFGPTHLQELAGFLSEHDRLHIQQITRLLKS